MNSYEQALRLFERWCQEQMMIEDVNLAWFSIAASILYGCPALRFNLTMKPPPLQW